MPMSATETVMPTAGVLRALSLPNACGASLLAARSRSIRPVEYMPELQDDRAAVSTTKLTMPAASGMPISPNAWTNGLSPSENSVHLTTERITSSAPT